MFEIDPDKKEKQKEIGKKGVEAKFVKAVGLLGWKAYKFTSEMNRGVTDRIVLTPEQVWFVEIKVENGHMSKLQESFRDKCLGFSLNHFVVYGLKDIDKFIATVRRNKNVKL